MGNLRNKNLALLAKWGWHFIHEPKVFWCKVIKIIHGINKHGRHTFENFDLNLRSLWIGISKVWLSVDSLVNLNWVMGDISIFGLILGSRRFLSKLSTLTVWHFYIPQWTDFLSFG